MTKAVYVLNASAASDIEAIYNFGLDRFGPKQAVKYVGELDSSFSGWHRTPGWGVLHSGL